MKNKKIVKHKLLLLFLCLCVLLGCPLKVQASNTGGNADQGDGGTATQDVVGGSTWDHIGWLVQRF